MAEINMGESVIGNRSTIPVGDGYRLQVSHEAEDTRWDSFVVNMPGGHHVQTSLWAQVKATLGWQPIRIKAIREDQIIAGAQILVRSLPVVGYVGYVSKGPLFAVKDPELEERFITELQQIAREYRIQHLTVQPSGKDDLLIQQLSAKDFRPTSTEVAPRATLLVDLTREIDTILAEMKAKTRQNIRRSERNGITVREGSERDLDIYYQILTATGQRQNFSPYRKQYFTEMWRILNPYGYVKFFVAEFEGQVVSAQLAVPFGDTVINKLSVWSGHQGYRRPNEAVIWAAMQWAKAEGYKYYDLEGIKTSAAKAILDQKPLPESLKQSVTSYKLGFGGQVALYAGAYDYIYNPHFRWGFDVVLPRVKNRRIVKSNLKRLRTS